MVVSVCVGHPSAVFEDDITVASPQQHRKCLVLLRCSLAESPSPPTSIDISPLSTVSWVSPRVSVNVYEPDLEYGVDR